MKIPSEQVREDVKKHVQVWEGELSFGRRGLLGKIVPYEKQGEWMCGYYGTDEDSRNKLTDNLVNIYLFDVHGYYK